MKIFSLGDQVRVYFNAKFYEEQLCRTSLSLKNCFKDVPHTQFDYKIFWNYRLIRLPRGYSSQYIENSVSEGNERVEKHLYWTFFAKTSYFTIFDHSQPLSTVFRMIWKNFKKLTFWCAMPWPRIRGSKSRFFEIF